ncbi:uncharacterized protein EDB91DRAFT_1096906 [Suillus paluster]|uniref:uncharacterized protein n=1 Tax=Suillus paluster TaxID=48578 RepID=UPI001B86E80E|nr:uncharacterized protein EDB91DRAFT_1096906 [Suillus paluster]KAG1755027.1 hypothetical protein EDB91DRAFT_1096906 [Suillus paluster]
MSDSTMVEVHQSESQPNGSDIASLSPLTQLQFVSTTVLQQALDLVENILTSDEQLTVQSKFLPGSTIANTPMENNLSDAREAFKQAISRIEEVVPAKSLDLPLTLNAVTPFMQTFETTFGRELWFAGLHAVHHWSMVRVIAGELDIKLNDDFGFAPSTLVYKGSEALLGKAKI